MSFSSDNGYIPNDFATLMSLVREGINEQFSTTYTAESFVGTNFYKYFYALIQRLQEHEIKTSEIFLKLQQYFVITNETLNRPNTTAPGMIDYFADRGYLVSIKAPIDIDAGKLFVCADVDDSAPDYAAVKLAVCTIIKDCAVAGVISQGTEVESITLSNDQAFDFKFNLPTKIPVLLRLTLTLSENNQNTVLSPEDVADLLFANITARYRLGMNFEPQRYFSVVDAPWAGAVLLEWTDDAGANWYSTIFEADYDEVFTFDVGDISVIEA